MISDTQSIGGSGVKVWDSRDIPGYPAGSNVAENIKTYILSPQGEAHTFNYPANQMVTVYEGAKLQITDPGGTPPYTYSTDNTNVATIDANGLATLHNTGKVKFLITDSKNKQWKAEFSPRLYVLFGGSTGNAASSLQWCTANGGRGPHISELSSGSSVRSMGSVYGEWGDCKANGLAPASLPASPKSWTDEQHGQGYNYMVTLSDGDIGYTSSTATVNSQVAILTSFFDSPYNDITTYTLSPQGDAHTFNYPADKFMTVYDGAQIQLPDPGGLPPYSYKSSDNYIASVDTTGRVTLHNTGTFQVRIIDSTGKQWGAEFSPALYMLAGGYISPFEDAQPWCESVGGRLPTRAELSHSGSGRYVGSLFGEWGNADKNGFLSGGTGQTSWTSDAKDATTQYVVRLDSGQNITQSHGSYCTNQVSVLASKPANINSFM